MLFQNYVVLKFLCCSQIFMLFSNFYVVLKLLCCSKIFVVLKFLCCSKIMLFSNFYVVLCIFFVSFCALFVCKCVLYCCHRVATQLQFNKYIISYNNRKFQQLPSNYLHIFLILRAFHCVNFSFSIPLTHQQNTCIIISTVDMFRRLLCHLQGELYRMLETIVTIFDYTSWVVLHTGLQLYLPIANTFIILYMCILWVYEGYNYRTLTLSRVL
jgi:hypothetical protein